MSAHGVHDKDKHCANLFPANMKKFSKRFAKLVKRL